MSSPPLPILARGHAEAGGVPCFNGNYDRPEKRWIFTCHYLWASAFGGTLGREYDEENDVGDDVEEENEVQLVEYPDLSVALSKCPL